VARALDQMHLRARECGDDALDDVDVGDRIVRSVRVDVGVRIASSSEGWKTRPGRNPRGLATARTIARSWRMAPVLRVAATCHRTNSSGIGPSVGPCASRRSLSVPSGRPIGWAGLATLLQIAGPDPCLLIGVGASRETTEGSDCRFFKPSDGLEPSTPPYHRATTEEPRAEPGSRGHESRARRRNRSKTPSRGWTRLPRWCSLRISLRTGTPPASRRSASAKRFGRRRGAPRVGELGGEPTFTVDVRMTTA
jgi:hypothetical protein